MTTSPHDIKKLREETGASFLHIRNALEEAGGDKERAIKLLRAKGLQKAASKESRPTHAGIVEAYIHYGSTIGVLLELRSETDFVARNASFKELAHELAMHIAATNPADISALLAEPFIKDEQQTVGEKIAEASASFGERIELAQFTRFSVN